MSLEKALKIAHTILADIKKNMVTRNSIIPLAKLPFAYEEQVEQNRAKFGKSFDLLQQFTANLLLVREAVDALISTRQGVQKSTISTLMLQHLAVAYCKMGACGEFTTYALFELLKQFKKEHIDLPLTFIMLDSQKRNLSTGNPYNHACLLIGNVDIKPGERIVKFNKLPDTVICFDPSIGWIAPANKMLEINRVFLDAHEINHITTKFPVILCKPEDNVLQEQVLQIEEAAHVLSNQVLDQLKRTSDFKPFSLDDPLLPKLVGYEFGFMNQNTKKYCEDALKKCTSSLFESSLSPWKYYPRRDGEKTHPAQILFTVKDKATAEIVLDHLIKHQVMGTNAKLKRVRITGDYVVLIIEPNLTQLQALPKIGVEPYSRDPSLRSG